MSNHLHLFCVGTNIGSRLRQYFGKRQANRTISTSTANFQDKFLPESDDNILSELKSHDSNSSSSKEQLDAAATTITVTTSDGSITKEDFIKKFGLKPSVEVGIRARMLERQRKQAEEDLKLAAEKESNSGAQKMQQLFEKLELGAEVASTGSSKEASQIETMPATKKGISDSWKFLFDESELNESKETLDKIPGASNIFPSLSEYRSSSEYRPPSLTSESSISSLLPDTSSEQRPPSADRWKDPKMKGTERDAFKALFSSLFEQKKPEQHEASPGERIQSLFSNFNRTGLEQTVDGAQEGESGSSPFSSPANDLPSSSGEAETAVEDPLQVLRRQLKNLSKRAEPIYLDRKPKTPSFKVMESTVGPQDWLTRDPIMPQENTLFNSIREENKVAIRMRKELEEKVGDVVQVKQFVDDLITPFVEPQSALSSNTTKPTSSSLDGLLAQAILAISSTRSETKSSGSKEIATDSQPRRSLHPYLGQALVEHTRRQGLPVFIRAVRTESYQALLKSRWDAWHDGPGCLEILKEMQRSGALVDTQTKRIVRDMRRTLKTSLAPSSDLTKDQLRQYGWGHEEQEASLVEMINIISASGEDDPDYNMKLWAIRAKNQKQ
ncbi:hypothetical protein BGX27_000378 [Mortierella sp. AM989]|nr:hypothetical protein BGX27_000378 [Mortierella sp. AM989]